MTALCEGWLSDGSHVVLTSITFTEDPFGSFTKTFGTKTGLSGSTVHCTASGTDPDTGNTVNVDVNGVFVPPSAV